MWDWPLRVGRQAVRARRFARREREWLRITDAPRGTFVMRNTHAGCGLRRIRRGHSYTVSRSAPGGGGCRRGCLSMLSGCETACCRGRFERTYARSTVSQFHSVFFCALPRAQVAEGERDEPRIAAHFGAIWRHFARLLARFDADWPSSRRMALHGCDSEFTRLRISLPCGGRFSAPR
jgi:hypothetical protein